MPKKGYRLTPEHRRKISESLMGHSVSIEACRKMSRPMSEEHKKNLSIAKTGVKQSEEHLRSNSVSHIGQIPWNKGKQDYLSSDSRRRISEAGKLRVGEKRSPEGTANISAANKRRGQSLSSRILIGLAHKAPKSPVYRRKISNGTIKAIQEGRIPTYPKGCGQWFTDRLGRRMYLRSNWEVQYAKYLDSQRLTWKYQPTILRYPDGEYGGLPDFYVDEYRSYVEIKPSYRLSETSEMKQLLGLIYHENLVVLTETDLIALGLDIS